MIRVFIGYEPRQPVAYQVAAFSLMQHAGMPLAVTPLMLQTLPTARRGLTEFTYSRFLVPWLSNFEGVSIFLDSDVLVRSDITEICWPRDEESAVHMVCGAQKFEWPSVMVFNNEKCKMLTPKFICEEPLYDYKWASKIGVLPKEWNHLVGYDAPNPDAKLVHFTKGIPVWKETETCEFAGEWHETFTAMLQTVSHQELMGRSVHVAR